MDIGRNKTTLKLNDVVVALLSKEMRWKYMEGLTPEELSAKGRSISINKGRPFSRRSKSRGKLKSSMSPV